MCGSNLRQQLAQGFDVFGAVRKYLFAFFGGERPAFHDAIAHRVLAFRRDAAQAEILQCSDQPLVLAGNAFAVHVALKFGAQVQNVFR